jgi:hypothetical protein
MFLFNVLQDDGGDQGKLEAFINFVEDTIFEVKTILKCIKLALVKYFNPLKKILALK